SSDRLHRWSIGRFQLGDNRGKIEAQPFLARLLPGAPKAKFRPGNGQSFGESPDCGKVVGRRIIRAALQVHFADKPVESLIELCEGIPVAAQAVSDTGTGRVG